MSTCKFEWYDGPTTNKHTCCLPFGHPLPHAVTQPLVETCEAKFYDDKQLTMRLCKLVKGHRGYHANNEPIDQDEARLLDAASERAARNARAYFDRPTDPTPDWGQLDWDRQRDRSVVRKIVQVTMSHGGIAVLCNDGSLWLRWDDKWRRIDIDAIVKREGE